MYLWTAAPRKSQRLLSDTWWFTAWLICEFQFKCFTAIIFFLSMIFQLCEIIASSQEGAYYSELGRHCVSLGVSALSSLYVPESRDKFWHLLCLPCEWPCALVAQKCVLRPRSRPCPVCSRWLPLAPLLLFLGLAFASCFTYSVFSSQLEPQAQKWFSFSLRKEIWGKSSPNTSATGPWKKSNEVETLFPYAPTLA